MSTALARRLKKLEAVTTGPALERERRIAEGKCPDCGHAHGYLPTNGGAWRCVICGHRFVLQPGPACQQRCPVEGSHGCNSLQLLFPPDPGHAAWFAERWSRHASEDLIDSMAPEHLAVLQAWMQQHCPNGQPFQQGERWHSMLGRLNPPALVRAAWLLVSFHVDTRLSVSLAPDVAEVYLADSDAWPVHDCAGCGYPMPGRAKLRPDDTYEFLGGIDVGSCPVCGLDRDPGEEGAA